jgi:hypothetical protein
VMNASIPTNATGGMKRLNRTWGMARQFDQL